ncbi:hypothetical protein [Streptomyces sp. NPDC001851]|uniref:hypothetical protein n=1 Tax=Streptomyces sp. NPDC001851 TaxID=3154529 RepID=UPI0033314662
MSLVPTAVAVATGEDLVRALTASPGPLARPMVAVLPAQAARVELLSTSAGGTVPASYDAEDAARALAPAAARADWLARPPGAVPEGCLLGRRGANTATPLMEATMAIPAAVGSSSQTPRPLTSGQEGTGRPA